MNATTTNADTLINRWNDLFATEIRDIMHEGRLYLVTAGTGEGVFAYAAADFDAGLDAAEAVDTEQYGAFCDTCEPEESEDVARAVYAATGLQICAGGSCTRVVDFDDEEDNEDEEEDDDDDPNDISNVDYEGYWSVVVGPDRTAESTVAEFGLVADGLEEWIAEAEMGAWMAGGNAAEDFPGEQWAEHRDRLEEALCAAIGEDAD